MHVVLIHGMGRSPISMLTLGRRLRRLGHTPHLVGYVPAFESLDTVTRKLVRLVQTRIGDQRYALVGHSLGTVILRHALPALADHPPLGCYLLAPPMVACRAAKFFKKIGLYRLITGEMGCLLADDQFMGQLPVGPNTRVYAGIAGPRRTWLPFGLEPNDGILLMDETCAGLGETVVEVASMHTFIMNSKAVLQDMARHLSGLGT